MAPPKGKKSKAPAPSSASGPASPGPTTAQDETTTAHRTVGEIRRAKYLASRPYQVLFEKKGWNGLSADEKIAYTIFRLLESGTWEQWPATQQKDLLKLCEKLKIPHPLPDPSLVVSNNPEAEARRKKIDAFTPTEHSDYKFQENEWYILTSESYDFKTLAWKLREYAKQGKAIPKYEERDPGWEIEEDEWKYLYGPITEEDIQKEKQRRIKIAEFSGKKMPGIYEGDPVWDDVIPIPQDDGEMPLAAIAYTDEYAEAISYLRAVMARHELTPRALELTAHIIDLNPAHYTVWLYRASILFHLKCNLFAEIEWVNSVALANQKNYQIWHHRKLLIDNIYPTLSHDRSKVLALARSEADFMDQMFALDSKNYHVWSYREYFVRKLSVFPSQSPEFDELAMLERLLADDVRNNSAWAHRYFVVFSDPGHSTEEAKALDRDEKIPERIVEREVEFSKGLIRRAPMNQSGWNYVRGVLRKGGWGLDSMEGFAGEFVRLGEGEGEVMREESGDGEVVKSCHALELLGDVWAARGEVERADQAWRLLGEKYDRVRHKYWEYRREELKAARAVPDQGPKE